MRLRHLVMLTVLPLALSACSKPTPTDPRTEPPLVRAVTIQPISSNTRTFTGTVVAQVQSDMGFRVGGKVLERLVDAGQSVKRGQALLRLDQADLNLAATAQQEAVRAARAKSQQANADEARYRELLNLGAIPASHYDQIKANADAASAQLKAAEATAHVALNSNTYAVLVADNDGIIVETLAEPGQVVAAGQVVVRLAHAGAREAVIHLPETLRPMLGSIGQAKLYGNDETVVPATLRQLSNMADRYTRTFEARYVLESTYLHIPLGTTVSVEIPDNSIKAHQGHEVPIAALLDQGRGTGVWRIEGEPMMVKWLPVNVLSISEENARIASELKEGDRIVGLGVHYLHDGQPVRILPTKTTYRFGAHE